MARRALILAVLALLATAAPAAAETKTETFRFPVQVKGYQVKQEMTYGVQHPQVDGFITGMSVNVSPASSAARGATVTITGGASGCPNPQYELWYLPPGGTWALARGYAGGTFLWSTGGSPAGSYRFSVWARDTSSAGANGTPPYTYDAFSAFQYTLT